MIVSLRTPIGDIVAKVPRAGVVFEQHRIDYCCEGGESLDAACARARTDAALVLRQVQRAAAEALDERDWTAASLRELSGHIVATHHAQVRRGVSALVGSLRVAVDSGHPAATAAIEDLIRGLTSWSTRLEPHLDAEERRVFPAIVRAERSRLENGQAACAFDGGLQHDVPLLVQEHRDVDQALRELSRASFERLPPDHEALTALAALEADLHRHLHLENNILFPRAVALEAAYE